MKTAENIEKLIKEFFKAKKSFSAVSSQMDENVLNDALAAFEKSKINISADLQPSVWGIIIKSRIAKFAVAAIIAAAVIIGINRIINLPKSDTFAKAVEQLNKAHTLAYSVITKTNVASMPTVQTKWLFKEPGYMRADTVDGFFSVILDTTKGAGIGILPLDKKYIDTEMINIPNNSTRIPFLVIEKLKSLPARPDETLGRKEINGQTVEGFRIVKDGSTTTVWINPDTSQLVRVEIEFADNPAMNIIVRDFHLDAELDNSLFCLTPPAGFESMPARIQADVSGVTERHINEFFGVWTKYRAAGGSFPPKLGGSDITKALCAIAQGDKPIDILQ